MSFGRYGKASCLRCKQQVWTAGEVSAEGKCAHLCRRCELGLEDGGDPCPICLDPTTDRLKYTNTSNESWQNEGRCAHAFCRGCLGQYVIGKVKDYNIWNLGCPVPGCSYLLVDADVRKALQNFPREEREAVVGMRAKLRCETYGNRLLEILKEAGDAPPSEEQKAGKEAGHHGKNSTWALQHCQACPGCEVVIRKEVGCSSVICRCGQSFCFGCGGCSEGHGRRGGATADDREAATSYDSLPSCICNTPILRARSPKGGPHFGAWLRQVGRLPAEGAARPTMTPATTTTEETANSAPITQASATQARPESETAQRAAVTVEHDLTPQVSPQAAGAGAEAEEDAQEESATLPAPPVQLRRRPSRTLVVGDVGGISQEEEEEEDLPEGVVSSNFDKSPCEGDFGPSPPEAGRWTAWAGAWAPLVRTHSI